MRSPSFACSIVFWYASYSERGLHGFAHRDLVEHREFHGGRLGRHGGLRVDPR